MDYENEDREDDEFDPDEELEEDYNLDYEDD